MALYRQFQMSFWNDPEVLEFTPEQKYFYIYLLTNPKVSQCGIYEISILQITHETGYNRDSVEKLLKIFEDKMKIIYSQETNEICIINFSKYNYNESPKTRKHIQSEFKKVKNKDLINQIYGIDTLYKEYRQEEEEEEKEKEKESKKELYAENVRLTEKEYTKLIDKLGVSDADKAIQKLSYYKCSSGKKYKSDYAAINSWVVDEITKNKKEVRI